QSPTANANGWSTADTTVTFVCSDATSGVASCSAPTTVTQETPGQVINGTVTDNAGNSASDSATVKLDRTPPTLSGAPTSSPNGDGWYNGPVTIHWTAADT